MYMTINYEWMYERAARDITALQSKVAALEHKLREAATTESKLRDELARVKRDFEIEKRRKRTR